MGLLTFNIGGIHPPENKLSAGMAIKNIEIPKQVVIPMNQNLGAPSQPIVKRGDMVKVGQLIAEAKGFIAAKIHSPVSGKVFKIEPRIDSTGFRKESIIINVEGDEWAEGIDSSDTLIKDITLDAFQITEKIKECGIVGLGGATFPSHVKYIVPEGKNPEYLIINAVECEPYLTSDHQLMMEKGEEIIVGIRIMMKALGAKKTIIGIENNKTDAIAHLSKLAEQDSNIEVKALKVQYPQGGEKQLIDALLGRQIQSGKLPLTVGCVVNNVGTTFAIYEAIQKNKPLFERIVTVTGYPVQNPSNYRVRIGIPIANLLQEANCDMDATGKVINGGPMMGKSIPSIDASVTKGTSGVLAIRNEESKRHEVKNCIRCGKCTTVCPMGLEPHLLSIIARMGENEKCEQELIMDCIECGSCVYTCPSSRPLLDNIRLGKSNVSFMIRQRSVK
ncbi:MAG: electron transport complex subunit RsxC [Bacteroidetes bacterium 4572_112]|nr:MAG: electron transport complex subunit RsxC [Bacteroidetes bacterium 4572_112]